MVCKDFERLSTRDKIATVMDSRIIAVSEDVVGSLHLISDFYVEVIIEPEDYGIKSIKTYRSHEVPGRYLSAIVLPGDCDF